MTKLRPAADPRPDPAEMAASAGSSWAGWNRQSKPVDSSNALDTSNHRPPQLDSRAGRSGAMAILPPCAFEYDPWASTATFPPGPRMATFPPEPRPRRPPSAHARPPSIFPRATPPPTGPRLPRHHQARGLPQRRHRYKTTTAAAMAMASILPAAQENTAQQD
jgi:hypothetical protein